MPWLYKKWARKDPVNDEELGKRLEKKDSLKIKIEHTNSVTSDIRPTMIIKLKLQTKVQRPTKLFNRAV